MKKYNISLLSLSSLLACAGETSESQPSEATQLRAGSLVDVNSDVKGVRYTITKCDSQEIAHEDVDVLEGKTTETFLMIQCEGSDPGAIDVIAAINHEPDVVDVEFTNSKFVCGSEEEVCVSGADVDGDPLEFEIIPEKGCTVEGPTSVVGDNTFDGQTACFNISCDDPGRYDLRARVYDRVWRDGSLIRIEDWLSLEGYPNESHGQLDFFAYFDGSDLYPDTDGDGYGDSQADPVLVCDGDDPDDHVDNPSPVRRQYLSQHA